MTGVQTCALPILGIQNKGVEHILPVKMTEDEYEISQLYMTSKEKKIWKDTYEKKGEYYICKAEDEEKLDHRQMGERGA